MLRMRLDSLIVDTLRYEIKNRLDLLGGHQCKSIRKYCLLTHKLVEFKMFDFKDQASQD
jgi:hypothetical protein